MTVGITSDHSGPDEIPTQYSSIYIYIYIYIAGIPHYHTTDGRILEVPRWYDYHPLNIDIPLVS